MVNLHLNLLVLCSIKFFSTDHNRFRIYVDFIYLKDFIEYIGKKIWFDLPHVRHTRPTRKINKRNSNGNICYNKIVLQLRKNMN